MTKAREAAWTPHSDPRNPEILPHPKLFSAYKNLKISIIIISISYTLLD
jgi:hypothetical protein